MGPTKAPGPDVMNALFYQNFWHTMGENVVNAVLDYLHSGVMGLDINHTNIVLIHKLNLLRECLILGQLAYAMSFIKLFPKCWLTG